MESLFMMRVLCFSYVVAFGKLPICTHEGAQTGNLFVLLNAAGRRNPSLLRGVFQAPCGVGAFNTAIVGRVAMELRRGIAP
jgi:hypothetical protein